MKFLQKLNNLIDKNNSLLCVGLDPDLEKIPDTFLKKENAIFEFNKFLIDVTANLVCTYKPNISFYEAYGLDGLKQLKLTIEYLKNKYPEIPIILDAKRADIGNTAKMYAKSVFEYWKADGVTVHANLGKDSLLPFLDYKDKLTIVLLKTSNPDSGVFQNVRVEGKKPFFIYMAETIKAWNCDNIGLVVGATYPQEMQEVRKILTNNIILAPGLGIQKADTEKIVKAGIDSNKRGIMFNASRSILYSDNPKKEAEQLKNEINKYRNE